MEHLKTNTMAQPQQWWEPIFKWIADNTILLTSFALAWKSIDKVFKYYSEGRDERIEALIDKKLMGKVTPEIQKLSVSIDELKEAIWDLKK